MQSLEPRMQGGARVGIGIHRSGLPRADFDRQTLTDAPFPSNRPRAQYRASVREQPPSFRAAPLEESMSDRNQTGIPISAVQRDGAFHARLVVAGLMAGERVRPWCVERIDDRFHVAALDLIDLHHD